MILKTWTIYVDDDPVLHAATLLDPTVWAGTTLTDVSARYPGRGLVVEIAPGPGGSAARLCEIFDYAVGYGPGSILQR